MSERNDGDEDARDPDDDIPPEWRAEGNVVEEDAAELERIREQADDDAE